MATTQNYKILTMSVKFLRFNALANMFAQITDRLYKTVNKESLKLATTIKKDHLSGGPGKLQVRTGELRRRTFAVVPKIVPDGVVGRVVIGSNLSYAPIHVGPFGQTTTIKAKKSKSLVIPLSSALTSRGALLAQFAKVKSLWDLHPKLFRGSSKHNLRPDILYYKRGSNITPMFLLRKSITIRTRVWPEQIAAAEEPYIQNSIYDDIRFVTSRLQ